MGVELPRAELPQKSDLKLREAAERPGSATGANAGGISFDNEAENTTSRRLENCAKFVLSRRCLEGSAF